MGYTPQVLDAVFIAAGIENLARMDTNRFPDGGAALDRSRYHFVCHFITSWHQIEARFSNSVCVAVFDVLAFENPLHKTVFRVIIMYYPMWEVRHGRTRFHP